MERGIEAQRKRFFCRNRHDSLLIERAGVDDRLRIAIAAQHHHQVRHHRRAAFVIRSEEHTSELQSLMRISYAVFCLKKKTKTRKLQQPERQNKKIDQLNT